MNTFTKTSVVIITAVVLFIGYQNLVVIPREKIEADQKEAQAKINRELTAKMEKEYKYNSCMTQAFVDYNLDWNSSCETAGKEPNCTLFTYLAEKHEEVLEKKRDRCVTMYK